MKMKYLFSFIFLNLQYISFSQNSIKDDSLKIGLKWKNAPFYARLSPLAVYTGPGKYVDRLSQNIEIGKSFDIIDLGVSVGRNSFRPDSTLFLEGKVTMDVGNIDIFASEMTIGGGRVFDKKGSLMLELTYNIFVQVAKHWGVGVTTGYYDFSNEYYGNSKTFFGLLLRYGIQRNDNGGILGLMRKPNHQKHAHRVR